MKTLDTLDGIFTMAVGLLEEVDAGQDPALATKERAKAARNVRAYIRQFKQAGLVVRLHDADNQQVAPGKGAVALVVVYAEFRPTLAGAAEIVAKGGRLQTSPLSDACLVWRIAEPTVPEEGALMKLASVTKAPPHKPKARLALPADTKH